MTISDLQLLESSGLSSVREGPQESARELAARNRDIVKAVRAINESGGVGHNSELRFSIDRGTGQALIKIVDRVTHEVIGQVPPQAVLRAAEILRQMNEGDRIA